MKIIILGVGYVGLVSAACFAEFGVQVLAIDADPQKIAKLRQGEIPIYEPGLSALVARNAARGTLQFAEGLPSSLEGIDAVFIAVGTPSRRGDGHADLQYVFAAASQIAALLPTNPTADPVVVVTKSTVPVGTGQKLLAHIATTAPVGARFAVASNPEFLREGSAIHDFQRPDRVVIGVTDDASGEHAANMLRALYRPLNLNETPMLVTSLPSAELIKYAANAFLATKITFINQMADLCEQVGADVQEVARGMGLDGRIGRKFLHAGPGFGGSCFPKDTLALAQTARDAAAPVSLVEAVVAANDARKQAMAQRIARAVAGTPSVAPNSLAGKTIAILGVTFKPETDDVRESVALVIIPALQALGATIRAYDPAGMGEAAKLLPGVVWATDAYDAAQGADGLAIVTEWNEFRVLDAARLASVMKRAVVVDLRNALKLDPEALAHLTHYEGVGKG